MIDGLRVRKKQTKKNALFQLGERLKTMSLMYPISSLMGRDYWFTVRIRLTYRQSIEIVLHYQNLFDRYQEKVMTYEYIK